MNAVIETSRLGKRYRQWALTDCTLSIPAGHVVGLVGPNGAGKTTLLNLAVGLLAPTAGTIEVLGGTPAASPAQQARVGYLAQDAPVTTKSGRLTGRGSRLPQEGQRAPLVPGTISCGSSHRWQ